MQNLTIAKSTEKRTETNITVSGLIKHPAYIQRFADVLGSQDKANQFLASLTSAVNSNANLKRCDPVKVVGCAMIAASLNLDINPNLGFASIVPYKKDGEQVPQFQMGWKGFVQLAMRTGQYRTMNVTEVYEDEFISFNNFKGELNYREVNNGFRDQGREDKVVGYVFYFELVSGFSKMTYWSRAQMENHAKLYSKAYQYDLRYGKQSSPWTTNFTAMAEKTVVKLSLSKWGVLSTQMALANTADQSTAKILDNGDIGEFEYVDSSDKKEDSTEETKPEVKAPETAEVTKPTTENSSDTASFSLNGSMAEDEETEIVF